MSTIAAATPKAPWSGRIEDLVSPSQLRRRGQILSLTAFPVMVALALAPAALGRPGVLGLVAVAAVVLLHFIAYSPHRVGLAVVALVPITAGLARGFAVPGLRLSELVIVLGALGLLALPTNLRPRWSGLDGLVLLYVAAATLLPLLDLFLVSGRPLDGVAVQTLLGPVQFGLLYFVVSTCFRTDRAAVLAQRALLVGSLGVSSLGIAEALGPPSVHAFLIGLTGTTAFNTPGYTSVLRAASVFPVWLALAGYLLVVLVLGTALLLVGDREVLPRWALLLVLAAGLMALAATLTATVTLVFAVAALYLGWRHRKLGLVLIMIGVTAVLTQFAFGGLIAQRAQEQGVSTAVYRVGPSWLPETLAYRVQVWQDQYAASLTSYAATGYGPGFPPGVDWSHTESGYITMLLRGGVPYLVVTAVLLAGLVRRGRREAAVAPSRSRSALCEAAVVLAVIQVPINLTFPYFTATGLAQPAWIVWGLLAGQEIERRRRTPSAAIATVIR